jgi:hypothetical protein
MMKIERITRTPDNDPWYVRPPFDDFTEADHIEMYGATARNEFEAAWDDIYYVFPNNAFDYRWYDWTVEVPF